MSVPIQTIWIGVVVWALFDAITILGFGVGFFSPRVTPSVSVALFALGLYLDALCRGA
jgi:hypothetical protein